MTPSTPTQDTERNPRLKGHLACFAAYAIFGVNIVVCKDLTSGNLISPIAIFTLRSLVTGALFWLLSLFTPAEKIDRKDYLKIAAAAFLGYFVTQMTFLMSIPVVTPMHCSIISSLTPIYTMLIAAVVLKEPLSWQKAGGVAISLAGVLFLIFNNSSSGSAIGESSIGGILLMLLNSFCFALYLGIFRPLISKYSVVTFSKWIFLFSALMALPFSFNDVVHIQWATIPTEQILELGFLIFFATFISYFLIPFGQKRIRPTLVSMYNYIQPIIATAISIIIGMELLTWQKILAAILVFTGVFIVSRSRRK